MSATHTDGWYFAPGDRVAHFYAASRTGSKVYVHAPCGKFSNRKRLKKKRQSRECKKCKQALTTGSGGNEHG